MAGDAEALSEHSHSPPAGQGKALFFTLLNSLFCSALLGCLLTLLGVNSAWIYLISLHHPSVLLCDI